MASQDSNGETASSFSRELESGPAFTANLLRNSADERNGLPAQPSPLLEKDLGMENFLLFVMSSSFCTLVASVTLLLRPLLGLP
jgi:hypothetical protein